MADFSSDVLEHLLSTAIDDKHRNYIRRLFPSFEDFFGLMGGTIGLPVGADGLEQSFDFMMSKFGKLSDLGLRCMKAKPISMSDLRSLPGEREAYDVVMGTLLEDDFTEEACFNGQAVIYEANTYAASRSQDTLTRLFGRHTTNVMRHFDSSLYLEMFRGYPLTAALAMVAMMHDDQAVIRNLLSMAHFQSLGIPVGSPKDDPSVFYVLYDD